MKRIGSPNIRAIDQCVKIPCCQFGLSRCPPEPTSMVSFESMVATDQVPVSSSRAKIISHSAFGHTNWWRLPLGAGGGGVSAPAEAPQPNNRYPATGNTVKPTKKSTSILTTMFSQNIGISGAVRWLLPFPRWWICPVDAHHHQPELGSSSLFTYFAHVHQVWWTWHHPPTSDNCPSLRSIHQTSHRTIL